MSTIATIYQVDMVVMVDIFSPVRAFALRKNGPAVGSLRYTDQVQVVTSKIAPAVITQLIPQAPGVELANHGLDCVTQVQEIGRRRIGHVFTDSDDLACRQSLSIWIDL